MLGYVPRRVAALLAPHMDVGHNPLDAVVTELTSDIAGSVVGAAVNVYLPRELSARIEGMSEEMHYYADVGTEGVTYLMVDCDEAVLNQLCMALTRRRIRRALARGLPTVRRRMVGSTDGICGSRATSPTRRSTSSS